MPQVSSLRSLLLFCPLKPSCPPPLAFSKPKSYSLLTTISSSKRHRSAPPNPRLLSFRNRSNSSSSGNTREIKRSSREKDKDRDQVGLMEESGNESAEVRFNKRRAEGRDKNDTSKRNLQLKVRKLNPTNTISYVQILGTGMDTQDTSPSVLLFFDKQRFIFNAGEGLQRFCTEHKIKLSKIDHIFLSRVCSETAGGIPGLLLTLAGMGEEGMSVKIWGPSDLQYLVDAMKSFIPHAAMVYTQSFGSDAAALMDAIRFSDPIVLLSNEVVKISAILLRPNRLEGSIVKPGDMSVVYLCELPDIMGKFDPAKAKALGLKPGPKYSELQSGKSVKSDLQDITVHPSDVMGPSVPGPIVLLVDCPTDDHAQELISLQSLNGYYTDVSDSPLENVKTVTCIIHLSPASVICSPSYQKWMKKFSSAQHIMAGHEMENMEIPVLKSSARIAARLNYLCPQFFPAPGFWSLKHLNNSRPASSLLVEDPVSKFDASISAENLLKFTLRPHSHLGLDKSNVPSLISPSSVIDELLAEIPEIKNAVQQIHQFWHGTGETKGNITNVQYNKGVIEEPWLEGNSLPSCLENIRRDDLEIVLLGTGSSQPSKYRNVSSVYVNLFSKGGLLLDCGEGTLGQLKRRYGVEGADNAVKNLRCVWISHIHADHHTGLARILALRRDLLKGTFHEPLLVLGPRQLKRFLDAYQRLEDLDMQFIDCRSTTEASWDAFRINSESKKDNLSPGNPSDMEDTSKSSLNTESTLFARGRSMQSYWKRPSSPIDNGTALPLLKSLKRVLREACLDDLISFPVVHCPQAFGIVLKASERINSVGKVIPGWKLVYSGDTRPCPELEEASRDATVLIHEASHQT
uniref:ribonuclease Z n=1 Tax=Rhizophora mucronata TaxID=61149 RepID=A0A2P2K614_RHIMU